MDRSCWLALVAVFALSTSARAEERDPVAAQALFDQARALMEQQRYGEACARFEESQQLDPGIGTQFHLAQCYEAVGRIASAWASFHEVASLASASGQRDRQTLAAGRAARLEQRLPKLVITVPPAARVSGLQLTRSGIPVRELQWDSELPVDPGDYLIRARAPGYREYAVTASAREGQTSTVTIPMLEVDPTSSLPSEAPSAAPVVVAAAPARPAPVPSQAPPWRTASFVVGALGVAALAAGVGLAVLADHKNEDSKDYCNTSDQNVCKPRGVSLRDDAFTLANAATASFVVGGVAVAGAITAWLVVRSGSERKRVQRVQPALAADLHRVGLSLAGAF